MCLENHDLFHEINICSNKTSSAKKEGVCSSPITYYDIMCSNPDACMQIIFLQHYLPLQHHERNLGPMIKTMIRFEHKIPAASHVGQYLEVLAFIGNNKGAWSKKPVCAIVWCKTAETGMLLWNKSNRRVNNLVQIRWLEHQGSCANDQDVPYSTKCCLPGCTLIWIHMFVCFHNRGRRAGNSLYVRLFDKLQSKWHIIIMFTDLY